MDGKSVQEEISLINNRLSIIEDQIRILNNRTEALLKKMIGEAKWMNT